MLFNSHVFIFVFLPLVLLGYYGTQRAGKQQLSWAILTAASLLFYAWNVPVYLLLILGSIAVNYVFIWGMFRWSERHGMFLTVGVALNLAVLFLFKYYDFFADTANRAMKTDFVLLHVALPLGISFFTFQQIGMLADVYRGEVRQKPPLLAYALFVSYFPQLVAGPIVEYNEMMPQFSKKACFDWENLYRGAAQLILGLGKKLLLADFCAIIADYGYGLQPPIHYLTAIAAILAYTFQLYFDFSGYCDMACGISRMFGIELPVNFDSPYKACSVTDFWKRWHMTLTRFLTRNVYIPLGGNRKGLMRTCLNVMAVFLLSGLWHGAGWTFLFWGGLHGLAMVAERLGRRAHLRLPRPLAWVCTFTFVNIAWVFFRAETFEQAWGLLVSAASVNLNIDPFLSAGAALFNELGLFVSYWVQHNLKQSFLLILAEIAFVGGVLFLLLLICLVGKNARELALSDWPLRWRGVLRLAVVFYFSLLMFTRVSPYLYFNF